MKATKEAAPELPFPGLLTSELPLAEPEHFERLIFLEAIQIERPEFWRELRGLERQRSKEAIVSWMLRSGVADDWFIDVIWDTTKYWAQAPDSPSSKLESGKNWFWYNMTDAALTEEGTFQIPPFIPWTLDPTFATVHPVPLFENGKQETMEKFRKRMRGHFETQLSRYIRYWESLHAEKCRSRKAHAIWTARAFTGESFIEIGASDKSLKKILRPEKVVGLAIRRFAERIRLTLR